MGRFTRRRWRWLAAALAVPVMLLGALDFALDEPLRRYMERTLNERLDGYMVRLGGLDFHVWGFSLDLKDLVVVQQANPDPPVARLPRWTASVQWRELLSANVVADFRFERPAVSLNLAHVRAEQEDDVPVEQRGWQAALQAVYPFAINELKIVGGDLTYEDEGPFEPLRLRQVDAVARNIRNIRSGPGAYPSDVHVETVVFEAGRILADGHADFLAEPRLGFEGEVRLEGIDLGYLRPIARRYNIAVTRGALAATGRVHYAPDGSTTVHLADLTLDGVHADYVHTAATKSQEQAVAREAGQTAAAMSNEPGVLLRIDRARLVRGNVGFVNQAAEPPYRAFVADTNLEITNLSNHQTEGTAVATLRGRFMGSGATLVDARFRPETKGPDFDLRVRIDDTDLTGMNDLLRAYGNFDVVRGVFAFYAELSVRTRAIDGYVKPLFRDLDVYDKRQDEDKNLFRKLYEGLVGGVSKLLENEPREEVATQADLSGRVADPQTSTWQILVRLIQNAFFKAILPGFEREVGRLRR
ncbi:MAG: DUF748 domain-containing protein [Candidatus Rokuibacteriota bacterium]